MTATGSFSPLSSPPFTENDRPTDQPLSSDHECINEYARRPHSRQYFSGGRATGHVSIAHMFAAHARHVEKKMSVRRSAGLPPQRCRHAASMRSASASIIADAASWSRGRTNANADDGDAVACLTLHNGGPDPDRRRRRDGRGRGRVSSDLKSSLRTALMMMMMMSMRRMTMMHACGLWRTCSSRDRLCTARPIGGCGDDDVDEHHMSKGESGSVRPGGF